MKKIIFYVIILLFVSRLQAQENTDSLLFELNTNKLEDTNTVDLLLQLSYIFRFTKQDTAILFAEKAVLLSRNLNFNNGKAQSFYTLGVLYAYKRANKKAFDYLSSAKELFEKQDMEHGVLKCQTYLGMVYINMGEYEKSLQISQITINKYEKNIDKEMLSRNYNNIGRVHQIRKNFDLSIQYFKKALNILSTSDDKKSIAILFTNIANLHIALHELDSAKANYKKAIEITKTINHNAYLSFLYTSMSAVYLLENNDKEALKTLNKSLDICNKNNFLSEKTICLLKLSYLYLKMSDSSTSKIERKKHINTALKYLNETQIILKNNKNSEQLLECYDHLSVAHSRLNQYKFSYEYLLKYNSLKDSLFNIEREHGIQDLEAKYQHKIQEKELKNKGLIIQQQLLKNKKEKFQRNVFIIGFISILIGFIVFVKIYIKQKKLSEMKIDFVNNMTHEFKTPLSNINLAVSILSSNVNTEAQQFLSIIKEEQDRLKKGIDIVLSTSLLDKNELVVNFEKTNIHQIIKHIAHNNELYANKKNGKIVLNLSAKIFTISIDEYHFINVINNLIENAIKYSNDKFVINISTVNENSSLLIKISDSGIGIAQKDLKYIFDKFYRVSTKNRYETNGFGIGLYYVKKIVKAHNAKINVTSKLNEGSVFTLTFKY